ncbi:hypothetical protein BLNAU_19442 [Blattamonas nauphoetae]|uniref:Cyclin N-terminal domain-containing protein n=1 Tax=Blattamonas nauphoetae TaxID=2049346 RepID=A0ABQ9X1T8_9EUKA|nr:hypothetical protein BLNAU_19442 [Blattamonas nauphoetae]
MSLMPPPNCSFVDELNQTNPFIAQHHGAELTDSQLPNLCIPSPSPSPSVQSSDVTQNYPSQFSASTTFSSRGLHRLGVFLTRNVIFTLTNLGTISNTSISTPNDPESASQPFVDSNVIYRSIVWIFHKLIYTAQLTDQEIVFSVALVERIFKLSLEKSPHLTSLTPTRDNFGTILVCAIMLATKFLRDKPFTNQCWADALSIPLTTINTSEQLVCNFLGFDVTVSPTSLGQHFNTFVLLA